MNITILSPDSEDLPIIAKWLFEEWGHLTVGRTLSDTIDKLKISPTNRGFETTFVAKENGFPVGVCRLTKSDMSSEEELSPWLASVFVPLDNRNKNIGRKLCAYCEKYAFSKGHEKLYLFTPDKSNFYLHMNWQILEDVNYRNQDVTIMFKSGC